MRLRASHLVRSRKRPLVPPPGVSGDQSPPQGHGFRELYGLAIASDYRIFREGITGRRRFLNRSLNQWHHILRSLDWHGSRRTSNNGDDRLQGQPCRGRGTQKHKDCTMWRLYADQQQDNQADDRGSPAAWATADLSVVERAECRPASRPVQSNIVLSSCLCGESLK